VHVAFAFPGQGSFRPGSLLAWQDHGAARVLDVVRARTGLDPWALDRDPTTGGRTADAQPAIQAASLVAWQALTDAGVAADVVAGHSLGEVTAAVAAGALAVGDGAALVATRGRAMGQACATTPGGLAAVVKVAPDAVDLLVAEDPDLVVANDNAPGQVVLAGPPEALARLRDRARDAGGRALPLDVEGAFHSPAMAPAVRDVAALVDDLDVRDPRLPLLSGTDAALHRTGAAVARVLVDGILAPVRWREVQLRLAELGVRHLVEVGPGGVLAGLARRTVPDLQVHAASTPDEVVAVADVLATAAVH
jgi:[acyl-carrier-protein] S-malonyltransferase